MAPSFPTTTTETDSRSTMNATTLSVSAQKLYSEFNRAILYDILEVKEILYPYQGNDFYENKFELVIGALKKRQNNHLLMEYYQLRANMVYCNIPFNRNKFSHRVAHILYWFFKDRAHAIHRI